VSPAAVLRRTVRLPPFDICPKSTKPRPQRSAAVGTGCSPAVPPYRVAVGFRLAPGV